MRRAFFVFMNNFLCLATFALLFTPAFAQSAPSLAAVVVDGSGAAIPSARIELQVPGATSSVFSGLTDASGQLVATLPPGNYQISISHPGFKAIKQPIDIPRTQTTRLTFVLQVSATTESVEVRADSFKADIASSATRLPMTMIQTPQQIEVLTAELMRSRGTESMKQAVEIVPAIGLQLGEGRRDNFFIRGFNAVGDMYIDGVRDDAQ